MDLPGPDELNPDRLLPKNFAKMSSTFLGLNVFPPQPFPYEKPPLSGGGTSFKPSSPF